MKINDRSILSYLFLAALCWSGINNGAQAPSKLVIGKDPFSASIAVPRPLQTQAKWNFLAKAIQQGNLDNVSVMLPRVFMAAERTPFSNMSPLYYAKAFYSSKPFNNEEHARNQSILWYMIWSLEGAAYAKAYELILMKYGHEEIVRYINENHLDINKKSPQLGLSLLDHIKIIATHPEAPNHDQWKIVLEQLSPSCEAEQKEMEEEITHV
jgi:hypothetical protein